MVWFFLFSILLSDRGTAPTSAQQNGHEPRFVGGAAAAANLHDPQHFPRLGSTPAGASAGASASAGPSSNSLAQKIAKSNRFTVRSGVGSGRDDEFPSLVADSCASAAAAASATTTADSGSADKSGEYTARKQKLVDVNGSETELMML